MCEQKIPSPRITTGPEPSPGTVFVVDDEASVRDALRFFFETHGLTVRTFAAGSEFLAVYTPAQRGCLVLDLCLPEVDGLTLQQELARRGLYIPTVVLTGHGRVADVVQALRSGVVDVLEKPPDWNQLLERVRSALQEPAEVRRAHECQAQLRARLVELTAREREALRLLAAGISSKAIARQWGRSPKTIDVHRARILRKLGVASLAELVSAVGPLSPAWVELGG